MMDRGRVQRVEILDGQVLLDLTLNSGEVRTKVPMLLPTGITAIPVAGADVILARVGGRDEDLVAIHADDGAARVTEAVGGDWAVRAHGGTALITATRLSITHLGATIEITTERASVTHPGEVVVDAPRILLGAGATKTVALDGDPVVGNQVRASATKVFGE